MNAPASIFVSYSQPDRACAFELVARVESAGFCCWIAPRDVSPSADWASEIIEAIAASRVMVLVFSANSNGSPQVRREVERAAHRDVRILPFRIEDVLPSKSLEYFLSSQHWLDAFPGALESHYTRLCAHLGSILAEPAAPAPLGARASAPGPAAAYTAAELKHIESALAGFVGPIARHLVRRAAAQAPTIEELVRVLSGELESDRDRRSFGELCRAQGRPHA
jgi:hypothetical protein